MRGGDILELLPVLRNIGKIVIEISAFVGYRRWHHENRNEGLEPKRARDNDRAGGNAWHARTGCSDSNWFPGRLHAASEIGSSAPFCRNAVAGCVCVNLLFPPSDA